MDAITFGCVLTMLTVFLVVAMLIAGAVYTDRIHELQRELDVMHAAWEQLSMRVGRRNDE